MHDALRKLQVWNQLLVICLNTPPRPTWGHSMISVARHPDSPLSSNHPTRVPIDWAWAQGSKNISNISWKWPSKILEPPRKFSDPPWTPPPPDPLRIDSFIYQSIALNVKINNNNLYSDWHVTPKSYDSVPSWPMPPFWQVNGTNTAPLYTLNPDHHKTSISCRCYIYG